MACIIDSTTIRYKVLETITSISFKVTQKRKNLPIKEFNNADFPAFLGPKTKHCKTFLSECCFLRSKRLLLVTRIADDGSPG